MYDIGELEDYYRSNRKKLNQWERRLGKEHILMEKLVDRYSDIDYEPMPHGELPPNGYRVYFTGLKTIVGLRKDRSPEFGKEHILEIKLPGNFPMEPAICYMRTDIWHPNIQSEEGPFKGRICGNTEGFGTLYSLDELILRIREMLSYRTYLSKFKYPYPEDEMVARWVNDYAEPRGIVKYGVGIIDERKWKNLETKA